MNHYRCFKTIGIFAFLFGAFASQALGVERFVAVCTNNGNGSSPSCATTSNGPGAFNTIQAAANVVNPGDTVTVLDGIYNKGASGNARVNVYRGGTPSNPIVIRAQNKHGAKVDATGSAFGFLIHGDANYITVDGFDIYNADGGEGTLGIFIRTMTAGETGGGGFIKILNNKIHHNGNKTACDTQYGNGGIFEQAHDVLIKGNIIYENGRLNCPDGSIHSSNPHGSPGGPGCCDNHHDHGIYPKGDNVVIEENIIYGNASFGISQILSNNTTIRNNVIYRQKYRGGINFVCFNDSFTTCTASGTNGARIIENNIIYDDSNRADANAIRLWSGGKSFQMTIRNNILFAKTPTIFDVNVANSEPQLITIINSGNIAANPLFINETAKDFHLQSTSPGKGTGFGGVDMGAYPVGKITDLVPPSPPTGVK